jgi:ABC-type oligopeptide transport system substrate-binding subunit
LAIVASTTSPFPSDAAARYQSAPVADSLDSSVIDRLIARVETAATPQAQRQAAEALDAGLFADAVSLPLFQYPQLLAYDKQYVNLVDDPVPGGLTAAMAKWGVPAAS